MTEQNRRRSVKPKPKSKPGQMTVDEFDSRVRALSKRSIGRDAVIALTAVAMALSADAAVEYLHAAPKRSELKFQADMQGRKLDDAHRLISAVSTGSDELIREYRLSAELIRQSIAGINAVTAEVDEFKPTADQILNMAVTPIVRSSFTRAEEGP